MIIGGIAAAGVAVIALLIVLLGLFIDGEQEGSPAAASGGGSAESAQANITALGYFTEEQPDDSSLLVVVITSPARNFFPSQTEFEQYLQEQGDEDWAPPSPRHVKRYDPGKFVLKDAQGTRHIGSKATLKQGSSRMTSGEGGLTMAGSSEYEPEKLEQIGICFNVAPETLPEPWELLFDGNATIPIPAELVDLGDSNAMEEIKIPTPVIPEIQVPDISVPKFDLQ